ncbi:tripartite motif-containing protein 2-like [Littorina saxatilis]|uniref:Uncharacterized protein n=1 Tax=Littorina saxatilis TaxID=31220 RepID=A0AAN9BQD3_9CAEN
MSQHEDIEEEYLTCYICYDVFTEPKTLTCLHRFCEKCLHGYLVGLSESARKNGFPCPVCREINPSPNPKRPAADWASLIRTDFHLKNLIKALKVKAYSKGQGGRSKEALHPCDLHAEKELDLYCVDCSSSICHLCAGISHRGCSQVITLTEAAADRRATAELQQRHLANRLGRLSQLRAEIDITVESLSTQRSQAETSIRQSSQAAIAAVRRRETELVEELARKFQSLRGDVAKRLVAVDNKMTGCQQVLETMSGKMKSSSDADLVHSMSSLLKEDLLDADEHKMDSILLRLKNIRLEHRPSPNTSVNLGQVSLNPGTPQTHPKQPTPSTSPGNRSLNRPPVPPRRARSQTLATMETEHVIETTPVRLRTISGKFREDQHSPKLRDILVLPEEKIVLATDWANQCIKAFHERRDKDSRLSLGGKPWCLTRLSDTAVAVSLPVSTQICVVKVTPRLMLQSSFFAQKRYSGLAALSADILVASGGSDPPCVDIINLGGEVLRSFSSDGTTGGQLFAYPGYITMMPDKHHFLVSDRRKGALFCLDTSGHMKSVFRPQGNMGLREPNGVATDKDGAVYLAETRGVLKVIFQGKVVRALLRDSDGVEDPRGLAIGADGLLYVTSHEENIVVFKIPSSR